MAGCLTTVLLGHSLRTRTQRGAAWLLVLLCCTSAASFAAAAERGRCGSSSGPSKLQPIDWSGRVFTVENFLSDAEVEHIIEMGFGALTEKHGDEWRTTHAYSNVLFQQKHYDSHRRTLNNIEERIAQLTMIPPHPEEMNLMFTRQMTGTSPGSHLENQALRNVHHDKNMRENRVVTVLMYLSDAQKGDGGHTLLPCLPQRDEWYSFTGSALSSTASKARQVAGRLATTLQNLYNNGTRIITAEGQHPGAIGYDAIVECNRQCAMAEHSQVLSIRPRKGMALVVWHVHPDGQPNLAAWHAACQAMGGEQRLALQKFKEAPRVTGEWVLDEGSTSPRWRDISEIEQPEDEIRSGFGSGYALFKDMGDL